MSNTHHSIAARIVLAVLLLLLLLGVFRSHEDAGVSYWAPGATTLSGAVSPGASRQV